MSALIPRRSTLIDTELFSRTNGPKLSAKKFLLMATQLLKFKLAEIVSSRLKSAKTASNQASCSLKTPVLSDSCTALRINLKTIEIDSEQSFSAVPMHFRVFSESRKSKNLRESSFLQKLWQLVVFSANCYNAGPSISLIVQSHRLCGTQIYANSERENGICVGY